MTQEQFLDMQARAKGFAYNSFAYMVAPDYQDAQILKDDEAMIAALRSDGTLSWASSHVDNLIQLAKSLSRPTRMDFIPSHWENPMLQAGFEPYALFCEYVNNALFMYKDAPLICLPAKREDAGRLEAVSLSCKDQSSGFKSDSASWFESWMDKTEPNLGKDDISEVLCFGYGKNLIGYIAIALQSSSSKPVLWIRAIAVSKSEQGRGIGRSLMSSALRWGINHKARKAYLMCDKLNDHARRLYEGFGFHCTKDEELDLIWPVV